MEKYVKSLILFIIGYCLLNLSPSLEPLFLFKIFLVSSFFSDIELYILNVLKIVGLILVIYSTIMLIYKIVKK